MYISTSRSIARRFSSNLRGSLIFIVLVSLLASPVSRVAAYNWPKLLLTPPAVTRAYVSDAHAPVAPGVVHDQGDIVTNTAGRQAVHLLEIDTDNPMITFEASISNDRVAGLETTSSQANRRSADGHRAVAAINGDFWGERQAPIGLHVQNGELITSPLAARPTFGVEADGDPVIGAPVVTGTARAHGGATYPIARVNQTRAAGQLVLYTTRFDTSTRTDASGAEVVLSGVALPIKPNGTYSGTVGQVRVGAGDTPIGSGEVVLSGTGAAAGFLTALSPGDQVTFALSISAGWGNVANAVGGGQYIVRNGAVSISPHDPGFADVTHPRTAIGITAGGDVLMATVDGRQPGYSVGVRLDELGEVLRARGAVTAINLDGGGSTTMAVRRPGDKDVTPVNRGSDGFERAVSNSLLVLSSAPTGPLAIANVLPPNAAVLIGSHIDYSVRGQDAAYNPVAVAPEDIHWSVEGAAATIDAAGRLTAITSGKSMVTATIGEVSGRTRVRVVNALSAIEVQPNPAMVPFGATQAFTILGRDGDRTDVRVDASRVAWSVVGPIGAIDGNGVLSAAETPGTGSIVASAGGATGRARVDVGGRAPEIIEDFEDISDMRALAARATASLTSAMRPDPVRFGTRSTRLGYNFTMSAPGTSAAYAVHSPLREIDGRPSRIGIWLYGDGSRHWVRGNYRDGDNTQRTIDFTLSPTPVPVTRDDCGQRRGGIDWIGWRYLEAPIPLDAVLPLKWERIYIVETSDLCDDASAIYLDDLRAVYSDTAEDLIGPVVSDLIPEPGSIVSQTRPTIGGTVRDNLGGSGVAAGSIRLLINGVQVPASYDAETGQVRYAPATALPDGRHGVRLEATDNAGNPAQPFGDWSFVINTDAGRKRCYKAGTSSLRKRMNYAQLR